VQRGETAKIFNRNTVAAVRTRRTGNADSRVSAGGRCRPMFWLADKVKWGSVGCLSVLVRTMVRGAVRQVGGRTCISPVQSVRVVMPTQKLQCLHVKCIATGNVQNGSTPDAPQNDPWRQHTTSCNGIRQRNSIEAQS
jgi:hypothetical protein